jgi:two-component system response regulator DevR
MIATKVLIVEDHIVVGDGLQALIEDEVDLCVVGRAASVSEAVCRAGELDLDVALVDYRLPDGTGADAAAAILRRHPKARILFLSQNDSDVARMSAYAAGAAGYLLKSQAATEVVDALRRVARGETLIASREVADLLALRHRMTYLVDKLTRRELEVLSLMANGMDNLRIATQLGIRYGTVRSHVRNLVAKMGVHSQLEAVNRGLELSLVERVPTVPIRRGRQQGTAPRSVSRDFAARSSEGGSEVTTI